MPLPADLPLVDHHCHLSPNGEGIAAVKRFAKLGGSHLFLATQNYGPRTPQRLEEYTDQFEQTEQLARQISTQTGVVAYSVVAPYPVDLVRAAAEIGLAAAVALHEQAIEVAAGMVRDQRAVALGEVGRPHFEVPGDVRDASERIFLHALEAARDVGCPAIVHCEDLDAPGYRGLAALAARVSFPVEKLVKHYARIVVPSELRQGVVPSYLARKEATAQSLRHPAPWFWETDFLDDPARPGAVLDLATIPRRAAALGGEAAEVERLRIPFVESIERVYGFTPTVERNSGL